MKRLVLLLTVMAFGSQAFAQDIITKKDATEIQAKVVKVGTSEIEYKQWNNPDGPLYTVPVNEVFTIKYENGQRDVISQIETNYASAKNKSTLNKKPHYEGDFGFGYAVNVNEWSDCATFETVHGVRINPYIFAGAGIGFYFFYNVPIYSVDKKGNITTTGSDVEMDIPVFAELKGYYPLSEKISLYGALDLGALIYDEIFKYNYDSSTDRAAGFYMTVGPGIQLGKHRAKFDFSVRYQHYGKKNGAMQFRFGMNF